MAFIAHNPASDAHDWPGHPETNLRSKAILEAFDADPVVSRLPRIRPDRPLTGAEIQAIHTSRLWINLEGIDRTGPAHLDPDTYMVGGSLHAALTTARLGIQAIERALRNDEGGFVVSRPPGHHATRDRSQGFCLVNNVALAAQQALDQGVNRILVFDHDVHHGNGTQEIFYESDQVLYQSFHRFPHYPGTGACEEMGRGEGSGYTINAPLSMGDGDAEVRALLLDVFLPIGREFRPELVIFSAGFDSLAGDPLGGLNLSVPFFGEIVRRYRTLTPRVVCFLEGGYQLDQIPLAALEEVHGLAGVPGAMGSRVASTSAQRRLRELLSRQWNGIR